MQNNYIDLSINARINAKYNLGYSIEKIRLRKYVMYLTEYITKMPVFVGKNGFILK